MRNRLYLAATISLLGIAILLPRGLTQPQRASKVDSVVRTSDSLSHSPANNSQSQDSTVKSSDSMVKPGSSTVKPGDSMVKSSDSAVKSRDSTVQLREGTSTITVKFEGENFDLRQSDLLNWLQQAARAVHRYYGRFPVDKLLVRVSAVPSDDVGFSTANDDDGEPVIHYRVGQHVKKQTLDEDWVAAHEMVHLAFPLVGDERWVAEGMATYVEPVARVQAGNLTAKEFWCQLVENLPRGLPGPGDKGLNGSRSIRRTYWGGALFYLLADIDIRKQTRNRKGLQDALVAIMRAGGDIDSDWEVERAFKVGDKAVGVHVLERMYRTWKDQSVNVNLPQVWTDLGVLYENKTVSFSEKAGAASVRRAIDEGKP
jgi:hypothetical protein